MAYYAIQAKQISGPKKIAIAAPPVLHEFHSMRARDEWVSRGLSKGEGYRCAVTAVEAHQIAEAKDAGYVGSPVRHYKIEQ